MLYVKFTIDDGDRNALPLISTGPASIVSTCKPKGIGRHLHYW